MRDRVPPIIQMAEMSNSGGVPRSRSCKIEEEAESFKVHADIFDGRVPAVKLEIGRELGLCRGSETNRHGRRTYLRAFRIKIAAKPLEMAADQHQIALLTLTSKKRGSGRGSRP